MVKRRNDWLVVLVSICLAVTLGACNTTSRMEIPRSIPEVEEAAGESAATGKARKAALFGEQNYKPIGFQGALSAIRHGTVVLHFPNSTPNLSGMLCNASHQGESVYEWRSTGKYLGGWDDEVGSMVHAALSGNGFDVAGNPDQFFQSDKDRNRAQILLGARLEEMRGNVCEEHHWWDGRPLDKYSAEIHLTVDWILYDALRRQEIATIRTTGYGLEKTPRRSGILNAFYDAWGSATESLASNRKFLETLTIKDDRQAASTVLPPDAPIEIEKTQLRDGRFQEYTNAILESTVTVRSALGHGSGYLISRQGYILTNAHVTGDATTVAVVFRSGFEVEGTVVRRHAVRDVALIRVPVTGGYPFPLKLEFPTVSDTVYAVGSPLSEDYQSTVTKGVVSALRKDTRSGLKLIQSDVVIQGGNSGGPVVDENGNVIAMSVSGLDLGAGSAGLNFLIPIASALDFLNIEIADKVAAQ